MVERQENGPVWRYIFWLMIYALIVAGYVGVRFVWSWASTDEMRLTVSSERVYVEGTLTPSTNAYPFGYAYPALNTFLAHLTGVPIQTLQTFVQPLLIALLAPLAYAAFRSLTGSREAGALAALFLFLQPEFLFESVRSSHPKMTWGLALTMLFVLAFSLRFLRQGRLFIKWVVLFYLIAFGLISSSVFFASGYIFSIAFAFLLGWLLRRWWRERTEMPHLHRLLYVTLSCSTLLFLFIFYLYRPAFLQFQTLDTIADRVATLFLNVEVATNPYNYVQATWVSEQVYLSLTIFNWLLLGFSFVAWLVKAWEMVVRRKRLSPNLFLLWLLYTGFVFLLALSVVMDVAGVLSANLQVRLFPHLMVVAIPLTAEMLLQWVRLAWRRGSGARVAVTGALVVGVLFFSAASLLKVTNEPLLSNNWVFYSLQESAAMDWMGNRLHDTRVWMGFNERLQAVVLGNESWQEHNVKADVGFRYAQDRYFCVSDMMARRATRMRIPIPDTQACLKIYDNGAAVIYSVRPQTPYQR